MTRQEAISRKKQNLFSLSSYSLSFLNKQDKIKLRILTIAQFVVSFMDAIGLVALGILVSIGITYTQGGESSTNLDSLFQFMNLNDFGIEYQMLFFGICAVFFLTSRTVISLFLSKKTFLFLGRISAKVSRDLLVGNFKNNFAWLRNKGVDDLAFSLTEGINYLVTGVLSSSIALVTELGLLALILILLAVVNFEMAIFAFAFFSFVGLVIYLNIHVRISKVSNLKSLSVAEGNKQVSDIYKLFREIHVTKSWDFFENKFFVSRLEASKLYGLQSWLLQIPRMSVEIAIVIGGASLAVVSIVGSNFKEALPDIVMFIAATSRLAPSVLRIQQAAVAIRGFSGAATETLDYGRIRRDIPNEYTKSRQLVAKESDSSEMKLSLKDISFKYEDGDELIMDGIDFDFKSGEIVALVGASGAGKSTLCDLILGVQNPSHGKISLNGREIHLHLELEAGFAAYLPQDVYLLEGTIEENVAFGVKAQEIELARVKSVLHESGLDELVQMTGDLTSIFAKHKLQLSGGQRQRVGLARALYSDPSILILDEPTSALDSETEKIVMTNLQLNKKNRITIIVAHREATIKSADRIAILKEGKLAWL
jgi:ABC-type multidrug transport system fused ATPase/permease subunit